MTRLFSRKDKTTIAELEEYYSTTNKKNNGGMAWLWAFLSIALTIILIIGTFFFVRWVYRSVTDDSSSTTTTVTETEGGSVELPTFDGSVVGQGNQNSSSETGSENGGVVSDEAATVTVDEGQSSTTAGPEVSTPSDSTSSTSNTGTIASPGTDIPNTGAGEVIVLVPLVVGFAGYYISRKRQLS